MTNKQQEYLETEFAILSWGASTQRSYLYKKHNAESDQKKSANKRRAFQIDVVHVMNTEILPAYRKEEVTEQRHLENLQLLVKRGTKIGEKYSKEIDIDFLGKSGYKLAVAQKLVNLQLKYLWCAGLAKMPPHCPVDAIILGMCNPDKTTATTLPKWTTITKVAEYQKCIDVIRAEANRKDEKIAEWELRQYQRR